MDVYILNRILVVTNVINLSEEGLSSHTHPISYRSFFYPHSRPKCGVPTRDLANLVKEYMNKWILWMPNGACTMHNVSTIKRLDYLFFERVNVRVYFLFWP